MFSCLIFLSAFFIPESPRWLYVNNKQDQSKKMLTKYHGEGNPDSEWVKLQLNEYEELLEMDGADKRWWDYSALFKNRSTCYRLFCNVTISIFGQWAGNGTSFPVLVSLNLIFSTFSLYLFAHANMNLAVLSYFMSKVLNTIGIVTNVGQANIILINNCQQFCFALFGANLVDRVGRRPLLLFSNIGCCLVWLAMTVSAALYQNSLRQLTAAELAQNLTSEAKSKLMSADANSAAAKTCLVFIFIFGAVYSVGFTPLQALYPVEVLSFEMRAKGMGFSGMAVAAANLLNQFAWPVSMKKIGWHTYIIFTIWCGVQTVVVWFWIPETKNRTLEELDEIFESDNPVRESISRKRLGFDAYGEVVNIQDVHSRASRITDDGASF